MGLKISLLCLAFLVFMKTSSFAEDDFQVWSQQSLKHKASKKISWTIFTDSRFNEDANKLGLYFISPRISYIFSDHLGLGVNYNYLRTRKTASTDTDKEYKTHYRAEVEVNPHWQLSNWLKIHLRNRMEFRWIEQKESHNTRYRQRWTLIFPMKDMGPVNSFYTSGEFFYDITEHDLNQNRTVPLGASFKLMDNTSFKLYYMIQSTKGSDDWSSNQVFGTLVSLEF